MAGTYYSPEFRRKILEMYDSGISQYRLSQEYGLKASTVKRWREEREKFTAPDSKEKFAAFGKSTIEDMAERVLNDPDRPSKWRDKNVVLVIPDLHCPWEHIDALTFLKAVRAKYQPNVIVNLGDEVDFYGMSRFDHDPDMINPGGELSLAIKHLLPFYKEFPNVLICQSNHTHRVHAKAQKAGLPSSTVKSIEEMLHTPEGWIYKQCHTVDGVDYKHGTGKSGANAHINHAKATGRSTCIGHIHAYAAVSYLRPGLFAANFACLIDKHAGCFKYASDMDDNIVLGCGIVIGGKEAHFIPLHVDANNRWTGEL